MQLENKVINGIRQIEKRSACLFDGVMMNIGAALLCFPLGRRGTLTSGDRFGEDICEFPFGDCHPGFGMVKLGRSRNISLP
jgi:hypothetical protein